ncbi:hypothetical protein BP5796_11219 [Coleophoma crateriformis]|uniref:Zn(2)-C6 fungal-type domain-containing protein n=1 Tax=Coleophoma crateriformis TaxID=565419 RepID=A0A3D8QHW4_9HELO|nr:hypothetical protein BP5796_11219 [Coleophoma crateriformis]
MPRVASRAAGLPATRAREGELTFFVADYLQPSYYEDASEEYIAASWLPVAPMPTPWMGAGAQQLGWGSDDVLASSSTGASLRLREQQQQFLYDGSSTGPCSLYEDVAHASYASVQQPHDLHTRTQLPSGLDYHFQTPDTPHTGQSSFHSTDPQIYQHYPVQPSSSNNHIYAWHEEYASCVSTPSHSQSLPQHRASVPQRTYHFQDETKELYTGAEVKDAVPSEPARKRNRIVTPEPDINEFVVVFENAPGALANIKRRRKLEAPVRKAAKEVRKAGACHQCRFRRRTCSTGSPCTSCIKNGNGLQELKCQHFEYSSKKRVVTFNVKAGTLKKFPTASRVTVKIDGIGQQSHPLDVSALTRLLESFSLDEKESIKQTADSNLDQESEDEPASVLIIEDGVAQNVEQWAVEYTSKFVHGAGPKFYSTTMAQILGTAYVKKGLPGSELVAAMLRLASLAFVLRAGVKYSSSDTSTSRFRTVQAKIDTILFQRLRLAERDLCQMLQKTIFRTAGSLTREQIYPVALVLWQLLRILSISASHLSNLVERFNSTESSAADYQLTCLKLVVSTHLALFRSSNPLLLDMTDNFNRDLLQNDEELIGLAMEMRKVVLKFRDKGFPDMKGSIAYRKEVFDMFRKVYGGK